MDLDLITWCALLSFVVGGLSAALLVYQRFRGLEDAHTRIMRELNELYVRLRTMEAINARQYRELERWKRTPQEGPAPLEWRTTTEQDHWLLS